MKVGLITEGPTDIAMLENILSSYIDIDDEHSCLPLQPVLDATSLAQMSGGGWTNVINYLNSDDFAQAILNFDLIIIQLDSDISDNTPINVTHYDSDGVKKDVDQLCNELQNKLELLIHVDNQEIYSMNANKCVWCLSVSSIECWIYHHIDTQGKALTVKTLVNCERKIAQKYGAIEKTYRKYQQVTESLSRKDKIETLRSKDISFHRFVARLDDVFQI